MRCARTVDVVVALLSTVAGLHRHPDVRVAAAPLCLSLFRRLVLRLFLQQLHLKVHSTVLLPLHCLHPRLLWLLLHGSGKKKTPKII